MMRNYIFFLLFLFLCSPSFSQQPKKNRFVWGLTGTAFVYENAPTFGLKLGCLFSSKAELTTTFELTAGYIHTVQLKFCLLKNKQIRPFIGFGLYCYMFDGVESSPLLSGGGRYRITDSIIVELGVFKVWPNHFHNDFRYSLGFNFLK